MAAAMKANAVSRATATGGTENLRMRPERIEVAIGIEARAVAGICKIVRGRAAIAEEGADHQDGDVRQAIVDRKAVVEQGAGPARATVVSRLVQTGVVGRGVQAGEVAALVTAVVTVVVTAVATAVVTAVAIVAVTAVAVAAGAAAAVAAAAVPV